jgi:hypothetical protein
MDDTIKDLNKETYEYLKCNEGWPSEFDMSINDISRRMIQAVKDQYDQAWLGCVNLYEDDRKKEYNLTEYTGQKIYNFEYTFVVPCNDQGLVDLIVKRDRTPYTGTKDDRVLVDQIMGRIESLNGQHLIWS